MSTTNDVLLGLGLVIVLALGCELIATRTRLPAIVLLLPTGFIAGAATKDVRPAFLFGSTFQPIVSLLDADNARLGVERAAREAELEDVTDALLLTGSDNFNALAAYELRQELGQDHVFRLARQSELLDLEPGYAEGRELFDGELTFTELTRRFDAGASIARAGSQDRAPTDGTGVERPTLLLTVS